MAARKNHRMTSVAALMAAAFTTAFPPQAVASEPETIRLYGALRDFLSDHPDFGLNSSAAPGHYAGNVSFFVDGDFKPAYTGTGVEVATQWRDIKGRPIAPHLFNFSGYNAWPEGTGAYMTGSISMGQGTVIDAWDSSKGDYTSTKSTDALVGSQSGDSATVSMTHDSMIYGSVLVGPDGDVSTAVSDKSTGGVTGTAGNLAYAPDPLPVVQPDLGASIGAVNISSNVTIDKDFRCDAFTIGDGSTVKIKGDIEIICDGRMTIGQNARIELEPGARLAIFTNADVKAISQKALVNANTKDPSRVTFYHLSGLSFSVSQFTEVYATIYAPGAQVIIQQDGDVYGRVLADELIMMQSGGLHIDKNLLVPTDACGVKMGDQAGAWDLAHNGAVDSQRSFRQWFRTVPGQNASHKDFIELMDDGTGVFEYAASDFTLADNKLLGHEGLAHNRNFTLELGAIGQFDSCQGQFFEFEGDGDAWLVINDRLVIDLGGLGAGKRQVADLDRMGFVDGEIYTLRFFYAQRTDSANAFKVRTNINMLLSEGVIPDSSGLFD